MANKKAEQSIDIKGHVQGIGNVIGSHSTSHVEIKFSLFQNLVTFDENKTEYQRNPKFTADSTRAFSPHPDTTFPELEHLIGHQAELSRLLELYDYAARLNKGAFVFLTGQYGYGTKALGRAFVDALREGHGRTATTRFWAENNERHSRRDVRWNLGFQRWQEVFDLSPDFLKQQSLFPFWGLFFQLCEKLPWMENEPLPTKLTDLPAYFRNCTQSGEPLVLLLEDFEYAAPDWHNLIRYLAKEVNHVLPILWIVTMHSDHPLDAIAKELLSPAQTLAFELAENNIAEIYHLSRVSRQDVENYVAPAKSNVAERLHRLTDGVPILVQNLWQDWRRTNAVFQADDKQWEMDHKSHWVEYGSGRDYIRTIFDQLWPYENEAPWSAEQMLEMLALAAQEGTSFTVEALAKAFNVETEKLVIGLEYLLDEPDDPGMIKEAAPVILEMSSANWKHTLERFEFSPLLVWFTLITYEKPNADRLIHYAESLCESVWPFVERVAPTIIFLYEQANQPELAKKFRQLTNENDTIRKFMAHAELLLEFSDSNIVHSRLIKVAEQLENNLIPCNYPLWTSDFASRMVDIFKTSQSRYFLGIALGLLGHSKKHLGEYQTSFSCYEKMLVIEEEVGTKAGVANALFGLGNVAKPLGNYLAARGYYEKQLALVEELGSKAGVANALSGLGDVARYLGDYPAARGYYEKQLALDEESGTKAGVANALSGLGDVARSLGDYQSAREHYEKKLAIDKNLGRKHGIADALRGLGDVASSLGEHQAAQEHYNQALVIEEELGRKDEIAETFRGLGDVAKLLFEYQVARGYYDRAINIFEYIGSPKSKAVVEEMKKLNEIIKRSKHESET